jgi:hypothetical protein
MVKAFFVATGILHEPLTGRLGESAEIRIRRGGHHRLSYPAALSGQTLYCTGRLIRRHWRQIGSPWRKLCDGAVADCSLRSVTATSCCPQSAWNGSWNGTPDYASAAGAAAAMICVISAASAIGAGGRTSCKRQVSGSIPLTGSRSDGVTALCMSRFVERTSSAGLSAMLRLLSRMVTVQYWRRQFETATFWAE